MAALLQSFDRKLSRALGQLDIGPLEYLAAPAAFLFGWEGTILVMGPATGLYDADLCRHYCLSGMLGQALARVAKQQAKRARPLYTDGPTRRWTLGVSAYNPDGTVKAHGSDAYSFPSGDSMSAGAFAGSLLAAQLVTQPIAIAIVGSVAFGRVYWRYHWASDTVVGGLLGLSSALVINKLVGYGHVSLPVLVVSVCSFLALMKLTSTRARI